MKRILIVIIGLISIVEVVSAQNIAITDDNSYNAHSSAMLDVKSLTKGMLVPRMSTIQRTSIVSPATGLLVFDTNQNEFFYYTGSAWTNLSSGQLWSKNGNYVYLSNTDNNVGIGVTDPNNKLLVKADATTGIDESIFAVLNNNGDTVFAVYQEGVRIWVDDNGGTKANGSRGGFAVGGFSPTKAGFTNEYLRVTPDSVRIYIDDDYVPAKANGSRGGFAVGGFSPSKGSPTDNYLFVQDDSSRVYVNGDEGFAVDNLAVGSEGRYMDMTPDNYYIGHDAGQNMASGLRNIFIGNGAGRNAIGGNDNLFMGNNAGLNNTTGTDNIFLGNNSGLDNTTGFQNTYVGINAGRDNSTNFGNAYFGSYAGEENTNGGNTFIGMQAGRYGNGTGGGWSNTFVGYTCGRSAFGNKNTFVGMSCGVVNGTGEDNVYMGHSAGTNTPNGSSNVYIGYGAGQGFFAPNSGSNNVYIGRNAGAKATGSGNIFIGKDAGFDETGSNKLYIETSSSTSPLIYGDFSSNLIRINGILNINNAYSFPTNDGTSNQVLVTNGAGVVNWTSSATLYDNDWTVSGVNMYSAVSGNVGIGTTSPSQKLDVVGEIELTSALYFTSGNFSIINGNSRKVMDSWWSGSLGATGLNVGDYTALNSAYDWSTDEPSSIITSNTYPLVVTIGATGNPGVAYQQALMVMNNSGDLGIGTTTPDNKFDVNGKISVTQSVGDEMVIINDNLWQHSTGVQDFGAGGDHFIMASKEGASESAGIYGDGNSITLWSPGDGNGGQPAAYLYILDEDGFTSAGTPYAGTALKAYVSNSGVWQVSDINKKQNITRLSNAMSKISSLNGYSYEYKISEVEAAKGQIPEVSSGIMAQEIELVLPQAVQTNSYGDKFVNYSALIPLLIEGMKEQQLKIQELEEQIQILKNK